MTGGTIVSLGLAILIGLTLGALGGGGSILTLPIFVFVAGIFLGVGGGFLIVPALVLLAGVETKAAVGSSLAIIALNAVGGLAGQLQRLSLNWWLTLSFLGLALVGMFGGLFVAEKMPGETISKAFGWIVVVLALFIGGLAGAGVRTTALN